MATSININRRVIENVRDEPKKMLKPISGYEKKTVKSLDDACEPIQDLFDQELKQNITIAKMNSTDPENGLSPDESASIHLYTMEWDVHDNSLYMLLNRTLRLADRTKLKPWFKYLKLLLTAFFKLPPSEDTLVWRGVREDLSALYPKDKEFAWWAISSCTTSMKVLESPNYVGKYGPRTMFSIQTNSGKHIRAHSYFENEDEILLPPGIYLKVIDGGNFADDLHIIQLREIPPPFQMLADPFDLSQLKQALPGPKPPTAQENYSTNVTPKPIIKSSSKQDKDWLDLQYHDPNRTSIKKPDELENKMEEPTDSIDKKILDRIQGSIIGMALGDALGAHVEFRPRQYLVENPVTDLKGGGTWGLKKGQFTDDTSMALCLANSLIARHGFVPYDQLVRYTWWYKSGYMSSTGQCFDIGEATKQSLNEFECRQRKFAKKLGIEIRDIDYLSDPEALKQFDVYCSKPEAADNGALMRLAPVPLFFYRSPEQAVEYSGLSGQITHGDIKAYDACRYYGALIVAALHGYKKDQLLDKNFYSKHKPWFRGKPLCAEIQSIAEGSYQKPGGYKDGIRGKGYIVNALEAALWAFWSDENSFEKGALTAVNLGDDTDTTAAIYGQLAGAYYGYHKLPGHWLKHVYARTFMEELCKWIAYEGEEWQQQYDQSGSQS